LLQSLHCLDEKKISNTIIQSWDRSQKSKVSKDLNYVPRILSDDELTNIITTSEVYQAFEKVYTKLEGVIDEKYAFALADHAGRIMNVKMKGRLYDQLGEVNFFPGGYWGEEVAGTNAIGTALAVGQAVTVQSSEHYCEAWSSFSCAGIPIWHPIKKQLVGVLDLTCKNEDFHNQSFLLTRAIVEGIQAEILNQSYANNLILMEAFSEAVQTVTKDTLLLIDEKGEIIRQNHSSMNTPLVWKSAFDWPQYYSQFKGADSQEFQEGHLPFLHNLPVGKIKPIFVDNKVIGLIICLPQIKNEHHYTPSTNVKNGVVGDSPIIKALLGKIIKISSSHIPVLLTGESGTGKEVFSQLIHQFSDRNQKPLISYNCSVLQHDLAASELFGYAPGSFTGGLREGKKGLFEEADGGILFLDEVGEIPLNVQPLLLRVLQENEVTRIGEYKARKINVRVIAATNRDLKKMMEEGTFREDLYYRLSAMKLSIPPLRERKEDIPQLIQYFLSKNTTTKFTLSAKASRLIHDYHWPGNVRELKNAIEYAVVFAENQTIEPHHLPEEVQQVRMDDYSLSKIQTICYSRSSPKQKEPEKIEFALSCANYNLTKAAEILGVSRGTLYNRLKKYNISY
jgi:sigma-54 dependent transcriptional regulator, acetoin dehydrogenase operon transcriptional activator AcoR